MRIPPLALGWLALCGLWGAGPRAVAQPAGASAPTASAAAPVSASAPASVPASAPAPRTRWYETSGPAAWVPLGSLDAREFPFRLELTTEGAAVGTLKLSGYYATVADKQLAARCGQDQDLYLREVAAHPDKYRGHYSLLNPVDVQGQRYLSFATRRVQLWLPGEGKPVEWDLDREQWRRLPSAATAPAGEQTVRFQWELYQDPNYADGPGPARQKPFLAITKTYTVRKGDYSVTLSLRLENRSDQRLKVALDQYGPTGVPKEDPTADMRQAALGKLRNGSIQLVLKGVKDLQSMAIGPDSSGNLGEALGYAEEPSAGSATLWIGVVNKFFGSMMYLLPAEANRLDSPQTPARFSLAAVLENPESRVFLPVLTLGARPNRPAVDGAIELAPGQAYQVSFDVFAGPKKQDLFTDPGAPGFRPLYKKLDYVSTISFRSCFLSWSALTLGMMWLLQAFSRLAFGNYGVAIIVLVILMRILLHPLTKKSQVMMARTSKLTPQMQKLKEKYAGDKDALQKEMMKLYKEQGFTPLLGCLPMLLQTPIWIALWSALNAAVELRHAAFLPVWLTDLAAPDAVLSWHSPSLPVIGTTLSLLPILGAVSTFLQSKLNPQMAGAAPAATPDQMKQQKLMRVMMPVMMLLIFYRMPSGLNLYIMTSNFVGLGEQVLIRRHLQAKEAAEASRTTTVEMPGRGPRSSRAKKPKGPLWFKRN